MRCFLTYHSFFNTELQFTSIFGIFYHCPAPWVILIYLKCNINFTVFSVFTSTLRLPKYSMKCAWQLNYCSRIKFNICIHEYGRISISNSETQTKTAAVIYKFKLNHVNILTSEMLWHVLILMKWTITI